MKVTVLTDSIWNYGYLQEHGAHKVIHVAAHHNHHRVQLEDPLVHAHIAHHELELHNHRKYLLHLHMELTGEGHRHQGRLRTSAPVVGDPLLDSPTMSDRQ